MEIPVRSSLTDDGTVVVAVLGEIDFTNADEIAQCIEDAVAAWSPELIVIDLGGATFIDSTGLGALIAGYRVAADGDRRFVVVNPSAAFRRVLTVTGLDDLFGVAAEVGDTAHDRNSVESRSSELAI